MTLVVSDSEDSDDLEDSNFLGAIDKDKTACLLPNPQDRKSRRRKKEQLTKISRWTQVLSQVQMAVETLMLESNCLLY